MQPTLGCGKDVGAGLDGAGAQQHPPMRLAGLLSEGGRHGDDIGAGRGERPVKRGKAKVVADAQAEPSPGQVGKHRFVAWDEIARLAVAFAAGKIDVEHMQLVVARGDLALGGDEVGAVGDLAGWKLHGERANMQPNAKLLGERLKLPKRRGTLLD